MSRAERVLREIAARRILLDLVRWRADHRTRQAIADLNTCHALWRLPSRQPRKESEQ